MKYDRAIDCVDRLIRSVGGYWPSLAAVARVLEEVAELKEALCSQKILSIREECADVFIIVASIAIQMRAIPKAPKELVFGSVESAESTIIINCGSLARAINDVEGIKPVKPNEEFVPLSVMINEIFSGLRWIATRFDSDLFEEVIDSTSKKSERDQGRFALRVDPATSQIFELLNDSTGYDLDVMRLGLWGMNCSDGGDTGSVILGDFARFVRAGRWSAASGFLVAGRVPEEEITMIQLGKRIGTLQLGCISRRFVIPGVTTATQFSLYVMEGRPCPLIYKLDMQQNKPDSSIMHASYIDVVELKLLRDVD